MESIIRSKNGYELRTIYGRLGESSAATNKDLSLLADSLRTSRKGITVTVKVFDDPELQAGYEKAYFKWQASLSSLKNGFSQDQADRLYRAIHELKQLSKILSLQDLNQALSRIHHVSRDLKERKVRWSESLISCFTLIHQQIDHWFCEQNLSTKATTLIEDLESHAVLRAYGLKVDDNTPEPPSIEEELVAENVISEEQLARARQLSQRTILEILIDEGILDQTKLDQFLQKRGA